ncbi:hypothetical protein AB0K02_23680 [Streptomyces sp. NPDC049597]|uniref:hypothetical protein n=1 Tax=Streptomyces sp. NPDC049597 TaxID=3155276 RepID=UPI003423B321
MHVGGCHTAGNQIHTVTRDVAAPGVAYGVEACSYRRAGTALGVAADTTRPRPVADGWTTRSRSW